MRRAAVLIALVMLVAPILVPSRARAAPVALKLTYVTYAAGFTTVRLTVTVNLTATGYRLAVDYRTLGMIGYLFPGHDEAEASGVWQGARAVPTGFQSSGRWGRQADHVQLEYPGVSRTS